MMMRRMVSVLLFVLSISTRTWFTPCAIATATANAALDTATESDVIRCVTEWGITSPPTDDDDDDDTTKLMTIVPKEYINDGYCDCIYSGIDETTTSACAGIPQFLKQPKNKKKNEIRFQCPQQPTLQLHTSRINDGICDCCDGADEMVVVTTSSTTATTTTTTNTTNHCPDNCATVLAAFRAEQKQRQLQFQKGLQIRTKMIASYQSMIQTTKTKIKQLTHDITERTKSLQDKYVRSLTRHQVKYTNLHVQRIYEIIYRGITGLPHDRDRYINHQHPLTLLHDLTIPEMETLIVLTCQLAGEIMIQQQQQTEEAEPNDHHSSQKTCVPLRLATMETGDMFVTSATTNNDTTTDASSSSSAATKNSNNIILRRLSKDEQYPEDDILAVMLANIYDYNSQYPQHPIFMEEDYLLYQQQLTQQHQGGGSKKKSTKRQGGHDDEMDYGDEEEEEEEYEVDEYADDISNTEVKHKFIPTAVYEDSMTSEQRTKFQSMMETLPLSKSRQIYIQRVQALVTYIDEQITTLEQEQSPEETEDLVLADEMDGAAVPIDHTEEIQHLQHIRTELQSRVTHIEHGYEYGRSALTLLSSITPDAMTFHFKPEFIFGSPDVNVKPSVNDVPLFHQQYLQKIFILTLYYSQLSVQQLYEILVLSLSPPTTEEDLSVNEEQQCMLPYAHLCPPTTLLKESIPVPKIIFEAMESFCHTLSMDDGTSAMDAASTTTCAATDVVPEAILDGYFGYYPIRPRDENDVVSQLLVQLGSDAAYCTDDEIRTKREMRTIQETVSQYHINLRSMEQTLQELKESIQNTDQMDHIDSDDDDNDENNNAMLPKYGLDGELHSIQDQCFDFTQGKYKYEICLFQGSSQKDIDSTGEGTSLGQWTGTYMERKVENSVEYDERIWKWEHGAQCWNGPQRSITAHVNQCGPITRIISANEPDTCRYVVEVESPIACDATYQRRYGLE